MPRFNFYIAGWKSKGRICGKFCLLVLLLGGWYRQYSLHTKLLNRGRKLSLDDWFDPPFHVSSTLRRSNRTTVSNEQHYALTYGNLTEPPNSSWAYVFLLGGARLERKGSDYRAGLFSVVSAAHALRRFGSKADVVLMVQLSVHADRSYSTLERWQEDMLQKLRIRVVYIPRFAHPKMECFYGLVMQKFRLLSLTEYSRVMFLDYDLFPKCNLDYIFALSDPDRASTIRGFSETPRVRPNVSAGEKELLKENVVLSYKREPSNAGLFVLRPNIDDYHRIKNIINKKERQGLKLPFPHWDDSLGWGHRIGNDSFAPPDDRWIANSGGTGTSWNWPFAYADQGLLYYWTKYVKKRVSLVRRDLVENWDVDDQGNLRVESASKGLMNQHSPCHYETNSRPSPYIDFIHFTGMYKPWFVKQSDVEHQIRTVASDEWRDRDRWYFHLIEALTEIDMLKRVSFDFMGEADKTPSVGRASSYKQMADYLKAKRRHNWNEHAIIV